MFLSLLLLLSIFYTGATDNTPLSARLQKRLAEGKSTLPLPTASFIGAGNWQGVEGLYRLDLPQGDLTPILTGTEFTIYDPHLSGNGSQIIFEGRMASILNGYDFTLYLMNISNSDFKELIVYNTMDMRSRFALSPNGQSLAFVAADSDQETSHIYTMDMQTGAILQLTHNKLYFYDEPTWSPDGNQIVYVSDEDVKFNGYLYLVVGVYIMNKDGSEPQKLVEGVFLDSPGWSPDGRFVQFQGNLEWARQSQIYLLNVETKQIELISTPWWRPWQKNIAPSTNWGEYGATFSPDSTCLSLVQGHAEGDIWIDELHIVNLRTRKRAIFPIPDEMMGVWGWQWIPSP